MSLIPEFYDIVELLEREPVGAILIVDGLDYPLIKETRTDWVALKALRSGYFNNGSIASALSSGTVRLWSLS